MNTPQHVIAVHSFGGLSFLYDSSPISILWESQKARYLFCYLLVDCDTWTSRDRLAAMLWPGTDADAAAKNFKTTLNRLRKSFCGARTLDPVITHGDCLRLNQQCLRLDVAEFKAAAVAGIKLVCRGDSEAARYHLQAAQDLYAGDFLPEEPQDDVIAAARREFAELYGSVLRYLERIYRDRGDVAGLEAFRLLAGILKQQRFLEPVS